MRKRYIALGAALVAVLRKKRQNRPKPQGRTFFGGNIWQWASPSAARKRALRRAAIGSGDWGLDTPDPSPRASDYAVIANDPRHPSFGRRPRRHHTGRRR